MAARICYLPPSQLNGPGIMTKKMRPHGRQSVLPPWATNAPYTTSARGRWWIPGNTYWPLAFCQGARVCLPLLRVAGAAPAGIPRLVPFFGRDQLDSFSPTCGYGQAVGNFGNFGFQRSQLWPTASTGWTLYTGPVPHAPRNSPSMWSYAIRRPLSLAHR